VPDGKPGASRFASSHDRIEAERHGRRFSMSPADLDTDGHVFHQRKAPVAPATDASQADVQRLKQE